MSGLNDLCRRSVAIRLQSGRSRRRSESWKPGSSQAIARQRLTSLGRALDGARCMSSARAVAGKAPADGRQDAPLARDPEQHLGHHQVDQLIVGDLLWSPAPPPRLRQRRKERAGSAMDCDQEGVEVAANVDFRTVRSCSRAASPLVRGRSML